MKIRQLFHPYWCNLFLENMSWITFIFERGKKLNVILRCNIFLLTCTVLLKSCILFLECFDLKYFYIHAYKLIIICCLFVHLWIFVVYSLVELKTKKTENAYERLIFWCYGFYSSTPGVFCTERLCFMCPVRAKQTQRCFNCHRILSLGCFSFNFKPFMEH